MFRNDEITVDEIERAAARAHRHLARARARPTRPASRIDVIRRFAGEMPILGVCLGHQCIGQAFGGEVVRAAAADARQDLADPPRRPDHLRGLPNPFEATRYHSLIVRDARRCPTAWRSPPWTDHGRDHGRCATRSSRSRACSSTPSRS